ncbi:hypothetical protein BayCH28_25590 [Mycolicibacterium sp. CH28]|uniref:hypothetical protein n=1 Tax=Mycolicibacterium sp. CH28 TaxID=2512237 RepID=UPI00108022CC|nr:hypothetical protein [Mycolicibacterium sp. CH28]TGD84404.1 hypothetical protein BayCH28_25590 [Mycolicibacterium sp. CH28]
MPTLVPSGAALAVAGLRIWLALPGFAAPRLVRPAAAGFEGLPAVRRAELPRAPRPEGAESVDPAAAVVFPEFPAPVSATAIAGQATMAPPTPRATASAPTLPT